MTIKETINQLKDLKRDRESYFERRENDDLYRADAEACENAIAILEGLAYILADDLK